MCLENSTNRPEVIKDEESGGYVVFYPGLKGCISCGETLEEAIANVQ